MTTEILDVIGEGDTLKIAEWLYNQYSHDYLYDDELLIAFKYLMRNQKNGKFKAPNEPIPVMSIEMTDEQIKELAISQH